MIIIIMIKKKKKEKKKRKSNKLSVCRQRGEIRLEHFERKVCVSGYQL